MIPMPFDQKSYVDQYQRANIIQVLIKLNRKTDGDIIKALEQVTNRQGYIKELIRADIASREG